MRRGATSTTLLILPRHASGRANNWEGQFVQDLVANKARSYTKKSAYRRVAAPRSAQTLPGGTLFLRFLHKGWGCFSLPSLFL
jgi:hypothetical protein